jgi:hypothetical protein
MRRVVSMFCALALAGCGGGGGTHVLPAGTAGAPAPGADGTLGSAARSAVRPSVASLTFSALGDHASQAITVTFPDASRKAAVSSDASVAAVSPPYQKAEWAGPNRYVASYRVTPVGAGTATITFSDHDGAESAQVRVTVSAPGEHLYVSGGDRVWVFDIHADGAATPQRTITGVWADTAVDEISVAPDGTLALVAPNLHVAAPTMNMMFYAPGASGAATPVRSVTGLTRVPHSLVQQSDGTAELTDLGELDTYATGANGTVAPIRRLSMRFAVYAATDAQGSIYTAVVNADSTGEVDVYAPNASGNAAPVRTIKFADISLFEQYPSTLAVGPDGTVYVVGRNGGSYVEGYSYAVYAYPPGASGYTAPSRVIPIASRSGSPVVVDRAGEIFASNGSTISVFSPSLDWGNAPIRTISVPVGGWNGGWATALAIGP